MTWWRWVVVALVCAVLLVGGGALGSYLLRSSSAKEFDAWRKASEQLVREGRESLRAHDDSLMREVSARLAAANHQAAAGTSHDTTAALVGATVAALLDSLAQARSASDSLRTYPPIVAGQQQQLGELREASASWREAFTQERQAVGGLLGRIAADSTFQSRVLAHLDSTPKARRGSLLEVLLRPRLYVRSEWGTGGWESRAGVCFGGCGR